MKWTGKFACVAVVGLVFAIFPAHFFAFPSVYPTGTTIYNPDKAWSGYVIYDTIDQQGSMLVDMNGNVVRVLTNLAQAPGPARILPGGHVMGGDFPRKPHQEALALVQFDWDGNEVWRFDRTEQVKTEDGEMVWAARLHHDWQREGNPVGYYAPGMEPETDKGRTLILASLWGSDLHSALNIIDILENHRSFKAIISPFDSRNCPISSYQFTDGANAAISTPKWPV